MIKKTLYFGNPCYLKMQMEQLMITLPEQKSGLTAQMRSTTIAIEDIGVIILDHQQITITHALLGRLLDNNVAVITCNQTHHPTGLLLNLDGNTLQAERFAKQINCSVPLKKQLWAQTIVQKIKNQAQVLKQTGHGDWLLLQQMAKDVKSGDPDNLEGRAAAHYWRHLFGVSANFLRDREGAAPNHLLNYGYAILRAITARSLVGSGLLPTLGIHHRNKYNAYCLADDIMEPYRPLVDQLVIKLYHKFGNETELSKTMKAELLAIPIIDVQMGVETKPLMIAMQTTTASLFKCMDGQQTKIAYPQI